MKKVVSIVILITMAITHALAKDNIDTVYRYFDAARNEYVLTGKFLVFTPIKATESSSGTYHGGAYARIEITEKERQVTVQYFAKAQADKKAQTTKNIKPNGAVEITFGNKKRHFLLVATAVINMSINKHLKQLMQQSK